MDIILEACVDSVESAIAAKKGGATRFELCANLIIGGTTPSLALLRTVKSTCGLPVNALLRPRFGDFCYTGQEFSLMLEEAAALLDAGADAIVSGCLTPEGDLDKQRLSALIGLAHSRGKSFTLHRAFDLCRDPMAAWDMCEELGVDTVLTSGQENHCLSGLPMLKKLAKKARSTRLLIGAGVNAHAIRRVREEIPEAGSFHMSGKKVLQSPMEYRKSGVSMGLPGISEYEIWRTDEDEIRQARAALEE